MPAIIFHNSRLSSVFPKKNPTAHSKGLSSDTAKASATTLLDCNTQEPTGNHAWNLPAHFSDALAVIADHEGPQEFRKRTLEADYGMTLEDYTKLLQAHETTRALLRKELAERRLKAQEEQSQRAFEQDLENIHGDD